MLACGGFDIPIASHKSKVLLGPTGIGDDDEFIVYIHFALHARFKVSYFAKEQL